MSSALGKILEQKQHAFLRGHILSRYTEPQRRYHNLSHLEYIFEFIEKAGLPLDRWCIDAILLHDIVYDPEQSDNEEKSAELADTLLMNSDIYSQEDSNLVCQMILDTKSHSPTIKDSEIVIDCDLAGLAASWDVYSKHTAAIQDEYSFLGDADFNEGRKKWIQSFLEREQIFYTDYGLDFLEYRARHNLTQELQRYE